MIESNSPTTEAVPELFEFHVYGVGQGYSEYYTSYTKKITSELGTIYNPAPISRSNFSRDTQFKRASVTIMAPLTGIVLNYLANNPLDKVVAVIYRSNVSINETTGVVSSVTFRLVFKGIVKNALVENKIANITCEEDIGIFKQGIFNVYYQSSCNHELFDSGCKLLASNFDLVANVDSISSSGQILSISELSSYEDNYFKGGYLYQSYMDGLVPMTTYRLITKSNSTDIYLHIPVSQDIVGTQVSIYPGCDGGPRTCKEKFNNYENFLGMPLIPSHNPVIWGFK